MTEPEDLEEDLFADLYDGDETTAPAPVAAPSSAPVPTQPRPTSTDQNATEASAFTDEPDTPYKPLPFESDGGNQTHGANGQHGNQMSSYDHTHNGDDVNMDNEPFGSGIKEDG